MRAAQRQEYERLHLPSAAFLKCSDKTGQLIEASYAIFPVFLLQADLMNGALAGTDTRLSKLSRLTVGEINDEDMLPPYRTGGLMSHPFVILHHQDEQK